MNRRFALAIGNISAFFTFISILGLPYFMNGLLKDSVLLAFWSISLLL